MAIFDVGRVCVKIAGRDARKKCVVVEVIDSQFVTIDGETRRRKCSIRHLEPLNVTLDLKAGADNAAVVKAMKAEGFVVAEKKASEKEVTPRPRKQKKVKQKKAAKPAEKKKADKKEAAPKKEEASAKESKPKAEKKPEVKEAPKAETKPAKAEKKE